MKWISKIKQKIQDIIMKLNVKNKIRIKEVESNLPNKEIKEWSLPTTTILNNQTTITYSVVDIKDKSEISIEIISSKKLVNINVRETAEESLVTTINTENNNKDLLEKYITKKLNSKNSDVNPFTKEFEAEIIRPVSPLPDHNSDSDYTKFEDHYKYYLTNGSNYEKKVVIQKVKKAVAQDKDRYHEWLKPLLNLSNHHNDSIRHYAFLTLLSFPLDTPTRAMIFKHFENDKLYKIKKRIDEERKKQMNISEILNSKIRSRTSEVNDQSIQIKKDSHHKTIKINDKIKDIDKPILNKTPEIAEQYKNDNVESFTGIEKTINRNIVNTNNKRDKDYKNLNKYTSKHKIKDNILQIKQECINRNIVSIYHFTNARNIPSIISSGILSVSDLKKESMKYEFNDTNRFDNMLNASCWSISFTNTKYFFEARKRSPEMKWCVIECDASVLWESTCYFFETNAASNEMKKIHYSKRNEVSALRKMFKRNDSYQLPLYYPTNVQAEVLISQPVLPTKIKCIYTNCNIVYNYYNERYPGLFKYNDIFYKYRN